MTFSEAGCHPICMHSSYCCEFLYYLNAHILCFLRTFPSTVRTWNEHHEGISPQRSRRDAEIFCGHHPSLARNPFFVSFVAFYANFIVRACSKPRSFFENPCFIRVQSVANYSCPCDCGPATPSFLRLASSTIQFGPHGPFEKISSFPPNLPANRGLPLERNRVVT